MKNIGSILLLALLVSCGGGKSNSSKPAFEPKMEETKVEFHPNTTSAAAEQSLSTGVKISVMVPADFTAANQSLVQSKLLQIVSRGGVSGIGGSQNIVIAPIFALLSEGVTPTAPPKTMLKYTVTFYVANILTGDVYSSTSMELLGAGDSKELALQNAINSISTSDISLANMVSQAQERIIKYYTENGDKIIAEAQTYVANNQYDAAITLLTSIPKECGELFNKAQQALEPIYKENVEAHAQQALAQMTSALANPTPENLQAAMVYYQQVPHDSPARAKADALYDSTKSKLEVERQQEFDYTREMQLKEFDANREREMMKLKINADGQQELLNKYKKDAAYERLPWIRKVVHLGDLDPFDGSGV